MLNKQCIFVVVLLGIALIFASISSAALVLRKGGKIYIVDQRGEHWDVTQAKTIGFRPEWFQYGIGKTAFTPLDDSHLSEGRSLNLRNHRVIGVADDSEARAYSVPKLRYHEIANTQIGEKKIAVGY
ncbi:MAG: DUF3179 domain-containing protein [Desulfobacterales bacterium]|nr:MAG: DUF3179 domain-containing protein [Desulfobacterales bacterium]